MPGLACFWVNEGKGSRGVQPAGLTPRVLKSGRSGQDSLARIVWSEQSGRDVQA